MSCSPSIKRHPSVLMFYIKSLGIAKSSRADPRARVGRGFLQWQFAVAGIFNGPVAARKVSQECRAHNPKVGSSNLPPATKFDSREGLKRALFYCLGLGVRNRTGFSITIRTGTKKCQQQWCELHSPLVHGSLYAVRQGQPRVRYFPGI